MSTASSARSRPEPRTGDAMAGQHRGKLDLEEAFAGRGAPGRSHRATSHVTDFARARRSALLLAYPGLIRCHGCGAERVDLRGVAGGVVPLSSAYRAGMPAGSGS